MVKDQLERLGEYPASRKLKILLISGIALLVLAAPLVIDYLEGSGFPGELERTQLGFDSEYIRECFGSMTREGMSMFIMGNLADYIFMVSYGSMFFSASLLLARRLQEKTLARKVGYMVAVLGVVAAISDGLENVFIISMALNPVSFPRWYAIPHSLFAHIKFKLMYATAGWIMLALAYITMKIVLGTVMTPQVKVEARI